MKIAMGNDHTAIELKNIIKEFVESYDGIEGTHDLLVHSYGPSTSIASIHAEVDGHGNIEAIHEVIDQIERDAKEKLGILLVIHMDPLELEDPVLEERKGRILGFLKEIDERLTLHDFRMVNGRRRINLIFDIVVPYDLDEGQVVDRLQQKIKAYDKRIEAVITIDRSYVGQEN